MNLSSLVRYATVLGLLSQMSIAAQVDIFHASTHGYSCFRVPSFIQAHDKLLVFVEARITSCADQAVKVLT